MANESISARILKVLAMLFIIACCLAGTIYLLLNTSSFFAFLLDTGFSVNNDKSVMPGLHIKYREVRKMISKIEGSGLTEKEIAAIRKSREYIVASAGTKYFREAPLKILEYEEINRYEVNTRKTVFDSFAALANVLGFPAEKDFATGFVEDYPFSKYQSPSSLIYDFDGDRLDEVVFLYKDKGDVRVAVLTIKNKKYELLYIANYSSDSIYDDEGKLEAALYIVPPPDMEYNAEKHKEYCEGFHYSYNDCEPGPARIKLRIKSATHYFSWQDGKYQ